MLRALIATLTLLVACSGAEARARHHHHYYHHHHHHRHYLSPAAGILGPGLFHELQSVVPAHHRRRGRALYDGGEVVAHPGGCPWSAFCGCGVSVKIFGHPVRDLFSAANWLRFPRAAAAPGRVAVFGRHHVVEIESVDGDGTVVAYDPNSGGHLTRVHRLSLAGAVVVDPRRGP